MKVAVLSFAHQRAATYVRLLHDMPGVEVVIADPDGSPGDSARGQATARRLGVAYAAGWDEALALGPQAVVVTSEIARRRELVERAAWAGAQVLCEPPLAATEMDARAMVEACADAGVALTVASPACFSPAFTAVRQAIAADDLVGGLTTIHGACNGPGRAGPGSWPATGVEPGPGGALAANASFLLDMVDAVLGGEPAEQVYAQSNSILSAEPSVESAALVTVRYSNGIVAALDCSWSLSADRPTAGGPTMTFVGERASVEFNSCPRLLGGFDSATAAERWEPGGTDLYSVMLDEFITAVGNGRRVGPDGASGVRALGIIQAAYKSARTGEPVDIR